MSMSSFNNNTTCQGRDIKIRNISKEYQRHENYKTETIE